MKHNIWKLLIVMALTLALCLGIAGCRNTVEETTVPTTTAPVTDPTTVATEPEETEPEPVIIQAGTISKHDKGKNGDGGIYFTMAPNDVPADTTWVTEYRPTKKSDIQLIRDGQTYDIGKTAGGMIIKYSDTEYYLKLEEYLIREYFPIRDNDILKISGIFRKGETMFQIDTSYMLISEGLVFYSTEYPEGKGVNVQYVGHPTSHPNGKTTDGIYFRLNKNGVPYNDWSLEYSPSSESAVQLIRDGKTYNIGNKAAGTIVKYNATDYYLKLEKWIIKDFYPIRDGDIVVLNGKFVNSGAATVFSISKTYISIHEGLLFFSKEYPTESTVEVVQIPQMLEHPNGLAGTGLYFNAAEENSLPFDGWSIEYSPRAASCVQLIRNGETREIGNVDAPAIVKYSETGYFLKLEKWIYKDNYPFVDGDILVIEGKFVNAGLGALMEIGKTYVAFNGGMAYLSTEYPSGPVGPTKIQAGTMQSHANGWQSGSAAPWGGLYFTMNANEAPFNSDWSVRYVPTAASNVKLIRDGQTIDVANTAAEMIAKYGEKDYFLEFWPISQKPLKVGDVLVVEGNFVNAANDVVLCIDKTYITLTADGAEFEGTSSEVIQTGYMQPHDNGWNTNDNEGLYFKLDANEVPYDGWNVEYEPASSASLKLVRGGETLNIGQPGKGTIVKFGDTEYYLKLSAWTIGEYAPIQIGDQLIVEGEFKNTTNGVSFAISRSLVTVGEDYALTFTQEENVDATIKAGLMSSHPNGWNSLENKGLYFTLASNAVPFKDDWTVFYTPTAANNIQLIRDGQTLDIAKTDREYIVKYGDTDYYLKLEKWTIGDYYPIVPGDVLAVGGKFTDPIAGVEFEIETTYISVGDGYSLTFSKDAPSAEQPTPESDGPLKPHSEKGFNTSSKDGLYAIMDANTVPYDGWNIEYTPAVAANFKLVRNGETFDIGIPGRGTLVKYSDTEYYLKFGWCVGDYANSITVGDQLIVEGQWKQNTGGDAVLHIEKTVIIIGENYALTFQSGEGTPDPEPPQVEPETPADAAPIKSHEKGWSGNTEAPWGGLYFAMDANDAPFNSDWSLRYVPTDAANVKLIRDGVTHDVANTAAEMIAKYGEEDYFLEFWPISQKPVKAGDVLVIEGEFVNAASGKSLKLAKTTVTLLADGTATFESEVEEEPEVPEDDAIAVGAMTENSSGITSGILYFTLAENSLPSSLTKSDFRPVSADAIKLIREGVTYDVADPNVKTIVKQTATKYRLLRSALTMELQAGDVLVVEGKFTGGNTGAAEVFTMAITKTYITIGDGTVSFATVLPPEEE